MTVKQYFFTDLQTWDIVHSLGQYPIVDTYLSTGEKVIPLSIKHLDTNTVQIIWSAPRSGVALISY